jgi:hypothetical protein
MDRQTDRRTDRQREREREREKRETVTEQRHATEIQPEK